MKSATKWFWLIKQPLGADFLLEVIIIDPDQFRLIVSIDNKTNLKPQFGILFKKKIIISLGISLSRN